MLNKELNHLAGISKSGNEVSEFISSTFLGKYQWAEAETNFI